MIKPPMASRPSDHDFARNAVVNATRDYVNQMASLLKGAGLGDTYPILIWRDRDGFLEGLRLHRRA